MASDLKPATRRAANPAIKAAKLLEEAAAILHDTTGKNAEAYAYIAARVDWCREKVLEQ